ncbi:MAG: signal recognition particle-docking protein FtsY [Proteobacteria bacterium]|nr:signal recognition particle-docking protein FtsY [Pseudomonadota bacterium]MBU1612092.1 signal recognition particle-docking protein FtsY [Pseudomonadota bacterium]
MGFFSKVKTLWKGDAGPQTDAQPVADGDTRASSTPTDESAPWRDALTLELRQAEPRLSQWLEVIVSGIDVAGPELWQRLIFLFTALQAPEDEARKFVAAFESWLDQMGYLRVSEFKSELQYRLALALDLEDEEDERDRLFLKLSEGVAKTKQQITRRIDSLISAHGELDDDFWDQLEEIFIMADIGYESTMDLVTRLKDRARAMSVNEAAGFREVLAAELDVLFAPKKRIVAVNPPEVVMMIGVNGVGKTTTIAKLAYRAQMQGKKVLIAAGDTFRAAASEQLQIWAKRVGAGFFAKTEGADPAAVAYEAMDMAVSGGYDLLLLDTAGRLHTKTNLMEELLKIRRVLGKKHEGAPHRSILVIDATTGQNALSQTKLFNEGVGVDEIVLTKLDGTAKGGVVVAVTLGFDLPITFVGLGEGMEDLRPFNGRDFARALLGAENEEQEP